MLDTPAKRLGLVVGLAGALVSLFSVMVIGEWEFSHFYVGVFNAYLPWVDWYGFHDRDHLFWSSLAWLGLFAAIGGAVTAVAPVVRWVPGSAA